MKKIVKSVLTAVLIAALILQTATCAFAASQKIAYVSEVVLSYGNTVNDAKKWLTDKGYSYIDCNLNEGADDTFSKARAVYMGFKTTEDPEKAITDMKLMNMNGGYSVQDYQMILENQKNSIKQFVTQFIAVLAEYRTNYRNGSQRAKAAYEMLNLIKDDDTGLAMGDLLLDKIKEEYTSEEFAALSADEQKKHADMTTILMQGNSELVLAVEQILATATDTNDILWLNRFAEADDYDTMIEEIMDEKNVTPAKAQQLLATKYDDDAKIIGSKMESYREWLDDYISADVKFTDGEEKVKEYCESLSAEERLLYTAEGAQYEMLNGIDYDEDMSLLDLFLSEDFDLAGTDSDMLYPIVSVLSDGQRAAIDFLNGNQLVAMGCNTDDVVTDIMNAYDFNADESGTVSVFDGIDRSVYGDDVALTGEAYKLQTSTDKDYSTSWFSDGVSTTAKVLAALSIVTIGATVAAFATYSVFSSKYLKTAGDLCDISGEYLYDYIKNGGPDPEVLIRANYPAEVKYSNDCFYWSGVFSKAGYCLTVISIIMSGVTLWYAYEDLKSYYNTDFTPIPTWMVDQGVNDKDEKIFTYYKAVTCNRIEGKFTADNTKLLKNNGDINGDVGKQWLALYTTTDKNAGDPILADFTTQVGNSNIPGDYTALSIFCNKVAQNLTDEKAGFTYNDDLGGIYLFYNTDTTVFAGSAITTGMWAIAAGGAVLVAVVVSLLVIRKKKNNKAEAAE